MSDDLKDILGNLNKEIEQDKLLDYLNKKLPATEAHELEKQMAEDPFVDDAVEGLQHFKPGKDLNAYVQQLNNDLHLQLEKKNARKQKRKLKNQPWMYFTIILILLLTIIGFILVNKFMNRKVELKNKAKAVGSWQLTVGSLPAESFTYTNFDLPT